LRNKKIKIISGGQSGVDRAALDFALKHRISCGGWCPLGRMAEDGKIPDRYPLKETESKDPSFRTRKNIEDSDGCLIIYSHEMDEGSRYTLLYAKKEMKPVYLIGLKDGINLREFKLWIDINHIKTLNVAGPRESSDEGIYGFALNVLKELFK
jgi:hypothetical protein